MAQRTVALYKGNFIGIETIYTVVNGQQINSPEKLKELRAKSQNNELFCPCGCGANLILVAGDKNLREQHFRIKDANLNQKCNVITEGKTSIESKIVLKCWLDDKLESGDIKSRVPIRAVDDINRSCEFSFLSQSRKTALSYCHERVNLSDEKLGILESNSQGIHIIYIVDRKNGGCEGQYPEGLMKVQHRQGYCLLLAVDSADYNEARMEAVFYAQDIDGLWREVVFAEGLLKDFSISDDGQILYADELLNDKLSKAMDNFRSRVECEKARRAEEEKRQAEEAAKRREEIKEKQRLEREWQQAEKRQREEDFKRIIELNFSQQETPIRDADGNRWVECEFCGKKAKESEFCSYGGKERINLGTCRECSANNPEAFRKDEIAKVHIKSAPNTCPECGGRLCERNGPYGRFMGCSNYPTCRYSCGIK